MSSHERLKEYSRSPDHVKELQGLDGQMASQPKRRKVRNRDASRS